MPAPVGAYPDLFYCRLTIDVTNAPISFSELAKQLATGFTNHFDDPTLSDGQTVTDQLVRRGLGVLLYLCCRDPDIQTAPQPRSKKVRRRMAKRPHRPQQLLVGYRVGARLAASRRAYDNAVTRSRTDTGRASPVPHWRAGHIKRVVHGPQRSLRRWQWIWPTFVTGQQIGDPEAVTTIRPVK